MSNGLARHGEPLRGRAEGYGTRFRRTVVAWAQINEESHQHYPPRHARAHLMRQGVATP